MTPSIAIPGSWDRAEATSFCHEALYLELDRCKIDVPVMFHIRNTPFLKNGYLRGYQDHGSWKYEICVNLFPFQRGKNTEVRLRYFWLYTTVAHEAEHLRLYLDLKEGVKKADFWRFLGGCEEIIHNKKSQDAIFHAITDTRKFFKTKRNAYLLSPSELICNRSGFDAAILALGSCLSSTERETIERIQKSLCFLNHYTEILYTAGMQPIQNFIVILNVVANCIKRSPEMLDQYKALRLLFSEGGTVIPIQNMYVEENHPDRLFYDESLFRYFLIMDADWDLVFQAHPGLRERIEELSNQYCEKCISYMKGNQIAKIYLSEDALKDNTAMILKNIKRLNVLMKRYRMEQKNGTVIPL